MHMSNHDARTMPLKDVPDICMYASVRMHSVGSTGGGRCIQEGARGMTDVAFVCDAWDPGHWV